MAVGGKPIIILMADDDPDDRLMTLEAFRECGWAEALRFARDGEELMAWLAAHPVPDLVLLDLNMPRKDGREALREMRADPRLRDIPVLVLTTSRADEDLARAQAAGVEFASKPVAMDAMLELVGSLRRRFGRDSH